MSSTYQKKCLYPGFMVPWASLLGKLSCIAVMVFISAQMAMLAAQPAQAAPAERYFQNPPKLDFREEATAPLMLPGAPTIGGFKEFDLNIQYTEGRLFNPATLTFDKVNLRSYVGTDTDPHRPYVAPLIEVEPGDTIRVNLNNKLPADPSCITPPENVNIPHCFNGTNLHTHGLWISPTGNGDNVLLSLDPGVSFQYEYNLPPDHPSGTFWYHPHRHGSTALQVSSGMGGALIVRGDRLPSVTANGDIDTLLKLPDGQDIAEQILVFQQIQYACLDEDGQVKKNPPNPDGTPGTWRCGPGDTGVIENYDNFGFGTWSKSGRYTSINGIILPTFTANAGEIQRWRLIHAGVRDTISLEFRKLEDGASGIQALAAADADRYIGENCTGAPIPYNIIADDGITRAQAWETTLTTLQPGYHNDALVIFPEEGYYCAIDASAPAPGNVSQEATSRQLLGIVKVDPGMSVSDIHSYLTRELVAAAEYTMPPLVKGTVIDDLEDDLKLTKFIPHRNIYPSEVTGQQQLAFNIDTTTNSFQVGNSISGDDLMSYNPDRIDRELTLGGVDEWILRSLFAGHPFHIHVNPFQIVAIYDPDGNDVSLPDATDGNDPQYRGLSGVWKDTLFLKGPPSTDRYYTIVLRTRYQRYIGEFVLHCHILDHEDQGMMQNISIVLPPGLGG